MKKHRNDYLNLAKEGRYMQRMIKTGTPPFLTIFNKIPKKQYISRTIFWRSTKAVKNNKEFSSSRVKASITSKGTINRYYRRLASRRSTTWSGGRRWIIFQGLRWVTTILNHLFSTSTENTTTTTVIYTGSTPLPLYTITLKR